MTSSKFEINGEWPKMENQILALLCQEYYHARKLVEPANVIFFKIGTLWRQLALDSGVIFWRIDNQQPQSWSVPELEAEYKIMDIGKKLGVLGKQIQEIKPEQIKDGVEIIVTFCDGKRLRIKNQNDNTTYES